MEMTYVLQLAQLISYAVLATIFVVKLNAKIDAAGMRVDFLGNQLAALAASFDKVASTLNKVSVQDEKINAIRDDINELRHGRGFVSERITGEYTKHGKVER